MRLRWLSCVFIFISACSSAPSGYKSLDDGSFQHRDIGLKFPQKLGQYSRDSDTPRGVLHNLHMKYRFGEANLMARAEIPGVLDQNNYADMMALTEENQIGRSTLKKSKIEITINGRVVEVYEIQMRTGSSLDTVYVARGRRGLYLQILTSASIKDHQKITAENRRAMRALIEANLELL